jgi:uncharacterized membrane protein
MANKTRELFQLERLAFFSDAVFAIAITLLVIEVRLPEMEAVTDASLRAALLELFPRYIGFFVSFLVIGRFWIGHHRAFGHLKTCDSKLIRRNMLFLMTIAFMPFPTAVISAFGGIGAAFSFYVLWLIFSGFLFRFVVKYAMQTPALLFDHDDIVEREAIVHGSWAPIIIGLLALIAGQYSPQYAFLPLFGAPLIIWLVGVAGRHYAGRRKPKA